MARQKVLSLFKSQPSSGTGVSNAVVMVEELSPELGDGEHGLCGGVVEEKVIEVGGRGRAKRRHGLMKEIANLKENHPDEHQELQLLESIPDLVSNLRFSPLQLRPVAGVKSRGVWI